MGLPEKRVEWQPFGPAGADQDRPSRASIAPRASATAASSAASGAARSPPLRADLLQCGGAVGEAKRADRPRRAFQRVRKREHLRRRAGQCIIEQASRLLQEHPEHLVLERFLAERHALQVIEIDRAVGGNRRRGWHPDRSVAGEVEN